MMFFYWKRIYKYILLLTLILCGERNCIRWYYTIILGRPSICKMLFKLRRYSNFGMCSTTLPCKSKPNPSSYLKGIFVRKHLPVAYLFVFSIFLCLSNSEDKRCFSKFNEETCACFTHTKTITMLNIPLCLLYLFPYGNHLHRNVKYTHLLESKIKWLMIICEWKN